MRSCTSTSSGRSFGRHSRPPFLYGPTSSPSSCPPRPPAAPHAGTPARAGRCGGTAHPGSVAATLERLAVGLQTVAQLAQQTIHRALADRIPGCRQPLRAAASPTQRPLGIATSPGRTGAPARPLSPDRTRSPPCVPRPYLAGVGVGLALLACVSCAPEPPPRQVPLERPAYSSPWLKTWPRLASSSDQLLRRPSGQVMSTRCTTAASPSPKVTGSSTWLR